MTPGTEPDSQPVPTAPGEPTAPTAPTAPTELFNPLISGLSPDPSVVRVGDDYYLVTSSFEYLPGLPIYHSSDFATWTQIGNVATRNEQVEVFAAPTPLGVYAPTIRHHNGLFYVVVTVVAGRGCVIFSAENPAGPWSDGTVVAGLEGIDPDLAWDTDSTAYLTYSGTLPAADGSKRTAILQVTVDVATGAILSEPRHLWSGTGLKFPEAPHLYQRGNDWYLLIAEGGTERGHGVSIARGPTPAGPFEGGPANPFLSARSTARVIQNTGHGDLVDLPDGSSGMILLGMRPLGLGQAYSILGRETFVTRLEWVDGWPVAEPVEPHVRAEPSVFSDAFDSPTLDPGWVAVRRAPADIATVADGALTLAATADVMHSEMHPIFLGRRQVGTTSETSVQVDVSHGVGGLRVRYDEKHHFDLEADGTGGDIHLTGRIALAGLQQEWSARLPAGPVTLRIASAPSAGHVFPSDPVETVTLTAAPVDGSAPAVTVAEFDGRYLSAEVVMSFTGRVLGPYCASGTVQFREFHQRGSDT
jgi:xylan 1,4-beta-xylosidase